MAMKIRLARGGSKKRPFYSIVASDSRMPRDGRFAGEGGDNGAAAQHQIAATETGYVGIGEHRRGVKPDGLAKRIAERQRQAGEFFYRQRGEQGGKQR